MHIVCQEEKTKKFDFVKVSENTLDFTALILRNFSLLFKQAPYITKQVQGEICTTYPELGLKTSEEKVDSKHLVPYNNISSPEGRPNLQSKPTYRSPSAALEATLQHGQKNHNKKASVLRVRQGKLKWLEKKDINMQVFNFSSITATVHMQPEQQRQKSVLVQ